MTARCTLVTLLAALSAGCAARNTPPIALPGPADPVQMAAALLVAAEETGNIAERSQLVAQLDQLGVTAVPEAGEDRLGEWRRETTAPDAPVYRGRALGPGYRRAQLAAGEQLVIEQIFLAGERTEMVAQTRAGRAVDVAVAAGQAQPVCAARLAPNARCRWLPIFTERFQITLVNRGNAPASVYLVFD